MSDSDTPRSGNDDGPSGGDEPSSGAEGKRPRAGRKASKTERSGESRVRTSPLDPWKKARERVLEKMADGSDRPAKTDDGPRGGMDARKRRDDPQDSRSFQRRRPDGEDRPRDGRPGEKRPGERKPWGRGRDDRRREDRRAGGGPSRGGPNREDRRPGGGPNREDRRPGGPRRDDRRRGPDEGRSDRRRPQRRDFDRRAPFPGSKPPTDKRARRRERNAEEAAQIRAGVRLSEIEELEVRIEKLVYGGDGLARFEGIPIFVPRTAPGDRVRIRMTDRKLGYGRAEVAELLEPGKDRRTPPCPHFERCGGCDLQHLKDEAQLRLKAESVVETLRRIGHVKPPARFDVVAGDPFGYRLRTQLHLGTTERGLQVGYFARGTHDLVPVDSCPVLVPELESKLPGLSRELEGVEHARVDLAAGDQGQWTVSPPVGSLPTGEITVDAAGFTYTYDARCFFQGHRGLVEDLVSHALGDFEDADGEAYDLFSGVGLFSLPLSRRYGKVVSVEGDRVAARFARRNAKSNKAANVEVVVQNAESWIEHLPKGAARVVVDPPRMGLSDKVRRTLMARKPERLTYVSCEPPTLARDLKELGRIFRIDSLTLIDMFPQTGHMESVVQLSLPPKEAPES